MAAAWAATESCHEDAPPESLEYEQGHGHYFLKKTFHKPTYCHHCTDMLWGLIGQGYVCEVCNFVVHDRCLKTVVSPCSSIAANLVKNPVAHCWSEPGHFKRKFCNICRKRLEDSLAMRCEICEYYSHMECMDFVVSGCKECATYVPRSDKSIPVQLHHWREGNLPGNSKCLLCKKTCWSSECLAGMRCEWCGVTAHAFCHLQLPRECSFGCLRQIMLPPGCLTVPRVDVSMETMYGYQKKQDLLHMMLDHCGKFRRDIFNVLDLVERPLEYTETWTGANQPSQQTIISSATATDTQHAFISKTDYATTQISEEFSSSGDSKTEEEDKRSPKEKEVKDKDKDRDEEIVRIFDGDSAVKKRSYRTVVVPKSAPAQVLLEVALRTFHISDNPKNYYITETTSQEDGTEREIDCSQPIRGQITSRDGKIPSVFLRYIATNQNRGHIRVYPGGLRKTNQDDVADFKNIPVDKDTTADEVLQRLLCKLGDEKADSKNYSLVELCLDKGVSECEISRCEKPWQIIQQSRRESLRRTRMTRFYLKELKDPHGTHIALYVGNLPTGLSQRQYEKILLDIIGKENKWYGFDVIYYEYGSLVLLYSNPDTAIRAYSILNKANFDDKQLLILLLPNIQPQMIPEYVMPLLVLVNVKSGGQQGMELIHSFRKLLNPHQVYNLMKGGPLPGLYVFRNVPYFKILVCGGDGTVGWALSCLDNVGQDAQCQSPPMAIVPLGTGNDLARVLRWGPGCTGAEEPINLLRDVIDAEEIKLDRWTVIFHPNEKETDEMKLALANDTNAANTNEDTTSIFLMNNYFGIGIDADLCLDFHMAREENPDKFNSRLHNKSVYLKMGLRKMMNRRSCKDLQRSIRIEIDGRPIELPPCEGIVILNILSWASGANPWGQEKEDHFSKPTHYDGMLEIIAVTGVVHLGQIQSGLRGAIRIAQGGHMRIHLLTDLPVQVDGEPWIQPAGQVVVLRSALKATMLKKSKNKIKRRNTEPNIYFPNEASLQPQSPCADGVSGPL